MDKLYDINKFPGNGYLIFGISMSKITNSQSAKRCFEDIQFLSEKVINGKVGVIFLYSDSLYYNSNQSAYDLKRNYETQIIAHKNEFLKLIKNTWYTSDFFQFITWSQILLNIPQFPTLLGKIKKIYETDLNFQEYVNKDIKDISKEIDIFNISYILEELVVLNYISKGKIDFGNPLIKGKTFYLNCYPGNPLKSEIYLFKNDLLKLGKSDNIYENSFYDLEQKKLRNY